MAVTRAIDGSTANGWALAAPAVLAVCCLLLVPAAIVAAYSLWVATPSGDIPAFDTGNWAKVLADSFYWEALVYTYVVAALTTAVCALLGYPVAYVIASSRGRRKILLIVSVLLPFWISYVIRTMSWIYVLGNTGLVNRALLELGVIDEPVRLLFTTFSVVLGLVHYLLPFFILVLYVRLDAIDRALPAAAKTLGARPFAAFRHVTLPLSLPGLAAACLLCFILASGAFVTAEILGGPRDYLFATLVYEEFIRRLDWPLGSVLALVLVASLGLLVGLYYRVFGGARLFGAVS